MINPKLDPEEQDILDSYERGEWQSIPNVKEELAQLREAARFTLANLELSIKLAPEDLHKVFTQAAAEGVTAESKVADIVHQYINGELVPR